MDTVIVFSLYALAAYFAVRSTIWLGTGVLKITGLWYVGKWLLSSPPKQTYQRDTRTDMRKYMYPNSRPTPTNCLVENIGRAKLNGSLYYVYGMDPIDNIYCYVRYSPYPYDNTSICESIFFINSVKWVK